jgi:acyl carrier protein
MDSNEDTSLSVIESSVINAIKAATYDPDMEISSSDSLINDLGIDSLELQVIFQKLSADHGVAAQIKNIMSGINDILDKELNGYAARSADAASGKPSDEGYFHTVLQKITSTVGLSFSAGDEAELLRRNLSNESRNLTLRYIMECITVRGIADCITFLKGKKD